MVLTRNKGSTLFSDGDTPNAIVAYYFWREHGLIVVDPNRPRHFGLDKTETVVSPKRYVNPLPPALLNFHDLNEIMKKTYIHFTDDLTFFNFLHQPPTNKSYRKNN